MKLSPWSHPCHPTLYGNWIKSNPCVYVFILWSVWSNYANFVDRLAQQQQQMSGPTSGPCVMPVYPTARGSNGGNGISGAPAHLIAHGPTPASASYSPYSPSRFHIDKRCQHRCSWKCASIALIPLVLALTAMLAYFAGKTLDACTPPSERARWAINYGPLKPDNWGYPPWAGARYASVWNIAAYTRSRWLAACSVLAICHQRMPGAVNRTGCLVREADRNKK